MEAKMVKKKRVDCMVKIEESSAVLCVDVEVSGDDGDVDELRLWANGAFYKCSINSLDRDIASGNTRGGATASALLMLGDVGKG